MQVKTAQFVISNTSPKLCPETTLPEYAFIGRSNVGKSSLINYITNHKKLAKTSSTPGKTQLINHFIINDTWYLVDLPGYGYAKTAKTNRKKWSNFTIEYLTGRKNLRNTFVLIDLRIPPQKIDIEFINWLGGKGLPFSIIFTKMEKLSTNEKRKQLNNYIKKLEEYWDAIPPYFLTSAHGKVGKEEILTYIDQINES